MLFDHGTAQRDACYCCPYAQGMVRQAYLSTEDIAQIRNGVKVGILGRSRIAAGAFEQYIFLAACPGNGVDSLFNIAKRGHPGGNDHWLPFGGHLPQ